MADDSHKPKIKPIVSGFAVANVFDMGIGVADHDLQKQVNPYWSQDLTSSD